MQNSVILCLECLGPKYLIDLNQLSRFESSGAYNHTSGIISKRIRQFKENCSERSLNVRAAADVGGCLLEKIFTHNKNPKTHTTGDWVEVMQRGQRAKGHLLVSWTRATKPIRGSWGVICMEGGGGTSGPAITNQKSIHRGGGGGDGPERGRRQMWIGRG